MSRSLFSVALAASLLALPTLALPAWAEGITVEGAYAITSRPGAPTGAAYMMIHNPDGPDDHLIDVASPVAERVELHTHEVDEAGIARMFELVDGLTLPAGGEITMERGGHHVMFLGIHAPFEEGVEIPITLTFQNAGPVEVVAVVAGPGGMDHMDHDHHDHGDHDMTHAGEEAGHAANH